MQSDFPKSKARRFRARRSTGDRVRDALIALGEAQGQLLSHEEKAWASITFSGTRHEVTFAFDGPDAIAAGECFVAALPDHEFTIPGQLVADAAVSKVDHTLNPAPRMVVTAALLLLEDV
ncbi:hypothetical protein [Altererythrobacter sp.]|uniref:hypothetical protein n=1 Tax=Altererythrobacter sp. TaxID=1872480 RepID=UPI003CFC454E